MKKLVQETEDKILRGRRKIKQLFMRWICICAVTSTSELFRRCVVCVPYISVIGSLRPDPTIRIRIDLISHKNQDQFRFFHSSKFMTFLFLTQTSKVNGQKTINLIKTSTRSSNSLFMPQMAFHIDDFGFFGCLSTTGFLIENERW